MTVPATQEDRIRTLSQALAEACAGQVEERLVVVQDTDGAAVEILRLARGLAQEDVSLQGGTACRDGTAMGVGLARLVIASTGTAVMDLGSDADQALATLLPRHVILVARTSDLLPDRESVYTAYAGLRSSGALGPRQALVTGPSRTADIEKLLVMPAHGPAAVTLVLSTGEMDWDALTKRIYDGLQPPSQKATIPSSVRKPVTSEPGVRSK